MNWTKQILQYLFVDMLVDILAQWQELTVYNLLHIEECDWDFGLWRFRQHLKDCDDVTVQIPERILPGLQASMTDKDGKMH